jgi:hypothetical protein
MFAIPIFGAGAIRSGAPIWLRIAAICGAAVALSAIFFTIYPIIDVPANDPIFRSQFNVANAPQITNIQFWRGVGGSITSERGFDSEEVHFRVIRDHAGRILVVMTHNTDIADSWEREGEDPAFFRQFSPGGYAFGINVLLHAMTH